MCHDLKPIADRSEVMCNDQKRLKFGLFVIFNDLSPITRGEKVVGYGLDGLKIGKKVIRHDLKPIAGRLEVICYDFEPITDRVEVISHHFEAVANRSERMSKTLVILPARLVDIEKAMGKLRTKRLLVDQFKSSMVKPEPLLELKREAAVQLATLVDFLDVMAAKDAAVYGEHYAVVVEIINRLNARHRKSKAFRFDDDDFEEDEELIEEPETLTEA